MSTYWRPPPPPIKKRLIWHMKVGVRMPYKSRSSYAVKVGLWTTFSVKSPFISRDFYVIRPLILWHILGASILLVWGVGVVKIIVAIWYFLMFGDISCGDLISSWRAKRFCVLLRSNKDGDPSFLLSALLQQESWSSPTRVHVTKQVAKSSSRARDWNMLRSVQDL